MRLLRLLTAAAVIGGAVVFLKRLMEGQAEGPTAPPEAEAPARTEATRETGAPASSGAFSSPTRASGSSASNGEPTKAELYERAQELGIEGRSKMSKRELLRAIEAAG